MRKTREQYIPVKVNGHYRRHTANGFVCAVVDGKLEQMHDDGCQFMLSARDTHVLLNILWLCREEIILSSLAEQRDEESRDARKHKNKETQEYVAWR